MTAAPPRRLGLEEELVAGVRVMSAGTGARRILYLHGGCYVFEIAPQHYRFCALLAKKLDATVSIPVYPLAPETGASETLAKKADVQQLELAALVCSQAIRKNPSYAPIHNTAGLIQNELGQVNGAVAEFKQAAQLDSKFFEAQMNYAAVNLGFRGFSEAEKAYKNALGMRPNDYDAHLGLALAIRGPITGAEADYDAKLAAVSAELDAAKKIDPSRPDAYYNEGIFTQEFKAKAGGAKEKTIATLEEAKKIYQTFLEKAQGKPEYDGAVKRVKGDGTPKDAGRIGDIDDTIAFLKLDANAQKDSANQGASQ